jgi:hypothetical protein
MVVVAGILLLSPLAVGMQAGYASRPLSSSSAIGVNFTITPNKILEGQQTSFTGSASGGQGSNYAYTYSGEPTGCPGGAITLGNWTDTCTPAQTGNFTINVTVTDGKGNWGYASAKLSVIPPLSIVSFVAVPPTFILNTTTLLSVSATGGFPPYYYNYAGLPPGCVSANSSILSCIPSESGTFSPSVRVNDSVGESVKASTNVTVKPPPVPTITSFTATPSTVIVDKWTNLTVNASGGVGPLNYAYGGLPPGCSSTNSAKLSCRPTQYGIFYVRVWANDTLGKSASATTPLVVSPPPLTVSLYANKTKLYAGGTIRLTITISGGVGPYVAMFSINGTNASHTGTIWNITLAHSGNYTYVGWVTDARGVVASSPAVKVHVNHAASVSTPTKTSSPTYPWWVSYLAILAVACALAAILLIVIVRRRRAAQKKDLLDADAVAKPAAKSSPPPVAPEGQVKETAKASARPEEWDENVDEPDKGTARRQLLR